MSNPQNVCARPGCYFTMSSAHAPWCSPTCSDRATMNEVSMTNAAYTAGIERGKAERKVEPPDASARIAQTLLWARENRFRVTQLSIGDVTIVLEDMGPEPGPSQGNPAREPSVGIVHGAWAQYLGIPMPDEEEEDGPEGPDPVEGAS